MTLTIDEILSRFENVRQAGPDRWTAACPTHVSDSQASLNIKRGEDLVLLHDFGGCETKAILDAVGLKFADLFAGSVPHRNGATAHAAQQPVAVPGVDEPPAMDGGPRCPEPSCGALFTWLKDGTVVCVSNGHAAPEAMAPPINRWLKENLSRVRKAAQEQRLVATARQAELPRGSVAAFPLTAFPEPARSYIAESAAAIGCPPDYVGTTLLVGAGACMGNSVAIAPKPDYLQYPVLFVGSIGDPGVAKSPALKAGSAPLSALQREAYEWYKRAYLAYQDEQVEYLKTRKQDRGAPPREPRLTHYFTTDATLEALASMIDPPLEEENHNPTTGVAWVADELAGWVLANNQYKGGKGNDRQRWLTAWSSGSLKVDRKGKTIYVTDPVIGVVGAIQPDVLGALRHDEGHRDGMEERLLYCWPDATATEWTEAFTRPQIREAMIEVFRHLRHASRVAQPVTLDRSAKRLWVEWFNENRQMAAAESGILAGYYAKLDVQCIRIALILHALTGEDYATEPVQPATMAAAIELTEYFRSHAHRALARLGVPNNGAGGGLAGRLLHLLQQHAGEWLKESDLNNLTHRNFSADTRQAALASLETDGLVESRPIPTTERGGRPGRQWRARLNAQTWKRGNTETAEIQQGEFPRNHVSTFARTAELLPCPGCGGPASARDDGRCYGCIGGDDDAPR